MKRAVLAFCLAFLFAGDMRANVEGYGEGVVHDGVAYVPARFIASNFGVDLRWGGDIRSLLMTAGSVSLRFTFDPSADRFNSAARADTINLPAILVNGETYVPLMEVCEALNIGTSVDERTSTVTLVRGRLRFVVHLSPETRKEPSREPVRLTVYKSAPPDPAPKTATIALDPRKTALVVIDFWGGDIVEHAFADNTASLVHLARKHGIPVIHAPHEGLALPNYRMNPRVLPIPEGETVLDGSETLESHFARTQMNVDTLLYAGFMASECLLYTRANSINSVARRTNRFDIVMVKDATTANYWGYSFVVQGVETKFKSTTIDDLSAALGDAPRAIEMIASGRPLPPTGYRVDDDFGLALDYGKTALLLINVWDVRGGDSWSKRVRYNTEANIVPLLAFARARGMKILHVPNGRAIDPAVQRRPDEPQFETLEQIRQFIAAEGITTLAYAGNLIDTTPLFPPIDVYGFTREAPFEVRTRLLEDCLIVYETKDSLPAQQFKKVFLERATAYSGTQHEVSRLAILRRNSGLYWVNPSERAAVSTSAPGVGRGSLRLIAAISDKDKRGDIVIADGRNQLVIAGRALNGTFECALSEWGRAWSEVRWTGGEQLLAGIENPQQWRIGYLNVLHSPEPAAPMIVRVEAPYAVRRAMLRLQTRNYQDVHPVNASVAVSTDDGATFQELGEQSTKFNHGQFTWSLHDLAGSARTLLVRITLPRMTERLGIESVRVTLDSAGPTVAPLREASLAIENRGGAPIQFDVVKSVELRKLPTVQERVAAEEEN